MKVMKTQAILTGLLIWVSTLLTAQIEQERLMLLTDRGHYISGEIIQYSALYIGPGEGETGAWSKVLYVELVLPNGSSLGQQKVTLDRLGAKGIIGIPEGLSSGTYYLKAYTRWMRNCGPEAFSYTSIQVYDSFNESVLPVESEGWAPTSPSIIFNQAEMYPEAPLECVLKGTSFPPREKIELEMSWKNPNVPATASISVVKAGLNSGQNHYNTICTLSGEDDFRFLPESRGLTLTGQAVSASDRLPAGYATIYVSVLGSEREFFSNYSDSAGHFYFSFPDYTGNKNLFVSTYHPEYDALELLIDRDFNNDPLQLPSDPVNLNDTLIELITEMSVNFQISQQYYPPQSRKPETKESDNRLFYGQPNSTILFEDFINLPRLEEYFTEVIPQVSVRKSKGKKRFVVLGAHPDLQIYQALVMIDGVAIFDIEAVLAVSPRLIDRVEIINAPYIRGNVTFGGIISLISRNNDLGYIDLPSSGLLVDYQMLDPWVADSIKSLDADSRLPDVRNTLYWNPDMDLQAELKQMVSFYTSDAKGDYNLLIRGIDSKGKYFSKTVPFRVE